MRHSFANRSAGGRMALAGAACLIVFLGGPVAAEEANLEAVLGAHATAHGGLKTWEKVKGLRLEGVFEAFSVEEAYVTHRLRPNLYHFQHTVLGEPTVLAYDGARPWVKSAAYGAPEGQVIAEDAGRNVVEDAVFGCPLLAHQAAGVPMELIGRTRHEGREYWEVKAVPEDGNTELWLLDPETGLEFRRLNQTFDVFSGNIEMEMETYYLDFRQVDDIVLPFREERHFGTRYHVRQASAVVVNPTIDRALFKAPAPPAEEKN